MPQVSSFSRSSDMVTALRRTKSFPVWLAVIAVLTVVVTLSTVVVGNLIDTHRSQVSEAADAAKAKAKQALARMKARTPIDLLGAGAAQNTAQVPSTTGLSDAIAQQAPDAPNAVAVTGDSANTSTADASVAGAASAHPHAHAQRHSTDNRSNATLRADIARYNAERSTDDTAQNPNDGMVSLRAASIPSGHSLWDEVPQPLSNIYRN